MNDPLKNKRDRIRVWLGPHFKSLMNGILIFQNQFKIIYKNNIKVNIKRRGRSAALPSAGDCRFEKEENFNKFILLEYF